MSHRLSAYLLLPGPFALNGATRRSVGILLPALLGACALLLLPAGVVAQRVLLDEVVTVEGLTLYPAAGPGMEPSGQYYYLPDDARLATDDRGRPEFSFLRFVENVRPEEGEAAPREGEGGGVVHFLVELGVAEDRVRAAERALARERPGAEVAGPLPYRSGTFVVKSRSVEQNTPVTLAVGKAPILEGQRASVSLWLTKRGATLLWESFQMGTSDVSVDFEMEFAGVRAPQRARLEADWDRIYNHGSFRAAVAKPLLAVEVGAAFDDLRDEGAIRLVTVDADAEMQKLVATAYEMLAAQMFEPVDGTGMPSLGQLAGAGTQGPGLLDRATEMLGAARAEARERNRQARAERERPAPRQPAGQREARPETAEPEQPRTEQPGTDAPGTGGEDAADPETPQPEPEDGEPADAPTPAVDRPARPEAETPVVESETVTDGTPEGQSDPSPPVTSQRPDDPVDPSAWEGEPTPIEPLLDPAFPPSASPSSSPAEPLACNLRLAYWTVANEAYADELESLVASEIRPLLDERYPSYRRLLGRKLASARSTEARAVMEGRIGLADSIAKFWRERADWQIEYADRRRTTAARDRGRLAPEVLRVAENDPRARELGQLWARTGMMGRFEVWLERGDYNLALTYVRDPVAGPDAPPEAEALYAEAVEVRDRALSRTKAKHLAFEQRWVELSRQIGLFSDLPRDASRCPSPQGALPEEVRMPPGATTGDRQPLDDPSDGPTPEAEDLDYPDAASLAREGADRGDPVAPARAAAAGAAEDFGLIQDLVQAFTLRSDDLWIVSLGDSFSSGEGNPTTVGVPINAWKWMDEEKCHRSRWGWPYLVADSIRKVVSRPVRLSFLACSGGELGAGLLESFTDRGVDRQPQLERLARMVENAGRRPDLVLMTGGGNDIGFSDIVKECIAPGGCPGGEATGALDAGLESLEKDGGLYDRVSDRLSAIGIDPDRVVLVMYPDPLIGRKRVRGGAWGPIEVRAGCHMLRGGEGWGWASENVVRRLQSLQQRVAERKGWRLATGHLEEYTRHSYCPRESFRGGDSWWVGILSSIPRQWGMGAFHPNRRGHRSLARSALASVGSLVPELPEPPAALAAGAGVEIPGVGREGEPGAVADAAGGGGGGPPAGGGGSGGGGGAGGGAAGGGSAEAASVPGLAVAAVLELRRERRRGSFVVDLNKYTTSRQQAPFSVNIGDLGRWVGDEDVFRQMNLDQPVFRQREVAFRLDGLNAEDFGEFVNFVNVQLKRDGGVREELTVSRDEFNERGNDLRLIYGFSGEESRDAWMRYEYRVVWSLFSGLRVEEPWQRTADGAVALAAPYVRRTVSLEGDPAALEGVRAVVVRLFYGAGEEERHAEVTLRPDRGEYVGTADVLVPVGEPGYEYEVTWLYGSQEAVRSGRQEATVPILFLDPPADERAGR